MSSTAATISTGQRRRRMMAQHCLLADGRDDNSVDRESGTGQVDGDRVLDRIGKTVDDLVALHSSDPVTVYLSLLARIPRATAETVGRSLYQTRDLVRVHGMRRTLWVGSRGTAADIVAASAGRLLAAERKRTIRMFQDGGEMADDAVRINEAWIDEAASELEAHVGAYGPCTTRDIGERLPHLTVAVEAAPGKKYSATISAHSRVLLMLGYEGRIIRAEPTGSWIASQYRWVTPEQWLADGSMAVDVSAPDYAASEAEARQRIIRRYIDRFGPVTEVDIAWWTGWPKGAVRRAMGSLDLVEVALSGHSYNGWLLAAAVDEVSDELPDSNRSSPHSVALLPGLDPTTMGWKQRSWYVDDGSVAQLFDRNGNGGPAVMVDGQLVGGWAQRNDGELVYRLLADVGREAVDQIEARLEGLARRLGDTTFKVRFPNPLNTELCR